MVLYDVSKAFEKAGYIAHVIKAGEMKAAGTMGTEITPEQLEYFQSLIDSFNEFFVDAVARGRKLPRKQVEGLADGRVHIAKNAKQKGLIDGIGTFDEVVSIFTKHLKGKRMSDEKKSAPASATLAELRAACPGADSDFLLKQIEASVTVSQAQTAYIAHMQLQYDKLLAQVDDLTAKNAELQTKIDQFQQMPGNDPLKSTGKSNSEGDVQAEWNEKIRQHLRDNPNDSRAKAVVAVKNSFPELHQALVGAANAKA